MNSSPIKATCSRIFACILITGVGLCCLYLKQNELTELRLAIPFLAKEVRHIQEENNRLRV